MRLVARNQRRIEERDRAKERTKSEVRYQKSECRSETEKGLGDKRLKDRVADGGSSLTGARAGVALHRDSAMKGRV
jgi:hypothetical protein